MAFGVEIWVMSGDPRRDIHQTWEAWKMKCFGGINPVNN